MFNCHPQTITTNTPIITTYTASITTNSNIVIIIIIIIIVIMLNQSPSTSQLAAAVAATEYTMSHKSYIQIQNNHHNHDLPRFNVSELIILCVPSNWHKCKNFHKIHSTVSENK